MMSSCVSYCRSLSNNKEKVYLSEMGREGKDEEDALEALAELDALLKDDPQNQELLQVLDCIVLISRIVSAKTIF